jgi:hypothetical protein
LQEFRAARLLANVSERQAVDALIVGQELEKAFFHRPNDP